MKTSKKILKACLIGLLCSLPVTAQGEDMDMHEPRFRIDFECQDCSSQSNEIHLLLRISEARWSGEVQIVLSGSEGVLLPRDTLWRDTLMENSDITRLIKVALPANDTSRVICNVRATHFEINASPPVPPPHTWGVAFVTGGDSLEFYHPIGRLRLRVEKRRREIFRAAKDVFDESGADFVLSQVNYVSKELNSARLEQFTKLRASRFGDEISITLKPFNSAEVHGTTNWTEYYPPDFMPGTAFRSAEHTRWYDVTFPSNATSGIEMTFTCGDRKKQTQITFVTTGDTVEIWLGPPMVGMPMQWSPRTDISLIEKYPYLFGDQAKTRGYTRKLPDSTWQRMTTEKRNENILARIAELEKTPCAKPGGDMIAADDKMWVRQEGETKFRLVDREEFLDTKGGRQSGDQDSRPKMYHIVLKIEQPVEDETLAWLIKQMAPMEREGYYHMSTSQTTLDALDSLSIPWAEHPNYPDED